jgi:hypothetical protein
LRAVQRKICDSSSALAKGITWEYQLSRNIWVVYDLASNDILEEYYQVNGSSNPTPLHLEHYIIDFVKMVEVSSLMSSRLVI